MTTRRRALSTLALAASLLVVGGTLAAPLPAAAATVTIPVGPGDVLGIDAEYSTGYAIAYDTTSLHVILPAEAHGLQFSRLYWSLGDANGFLDPTQTEFDLDITGKGSYWYGLELYQYDPPSVDTMRLLVSVGLNVNAPSTVEFDLARANSSSFIINRTYSYESSVLGAKVNWGDTLELSSATDLWAGGPDNASETEVGAYLQSSDLAYDAGYQAGSETNISSGVTVGADGTELTVTLPSSPPAAVDWGTGTLVVLQFLTMSGEQIEGISNLYLPVNFFPTSRIAGWDRFDTSSRVAQQFESADVVYLANGLNFPDALSAAPAAAFRDAPLLLTGPAALPDSTRVQLIRLSPAAVYIIGGQNMISAGVEATIAGLPGVGEVHRIAGVDRYDTSRKVVQDVYPRADSEGGAEIAFFATGANFPDALASSAAAAHLGAPVLLVPGSAATVDEATIDVLTLDVRATSAYIAGGVGTVSPGIEQSLGSILGSGDVHRLHGPDRYSTAVAINNEAFTGPVSVVYLAVGTGYADALGGAALAGSQDAPLFTVPSNCIPAEVLSAIDELDPTDIVLLGGRTTLSLAVANLVSC